MKIAIVTGATSGLCRAFLDEWQARDYYFDEVWLVARHQDRLEEVGLNLPWDARLFALDLSVESDRAMLARTLKEEAPRVQYVVNAAGYGKIGSVEAIDATEQVGMVELNCAALVDVTQLVLPYLTLGSVIFEIASVAAFLPQPNFAVYAASKSFVHSFSRALNAELKHKGARVVSVCPNPMATAFFERAGGTPIFFKQFFFEKPEKVAHAAVEAALQGRDMSISCKTGQVLHTIGKCMPHRSVLAIEQALSIDVGRLRGEKRHK